MSTRKLPIVAVGKRKTAIAKAVIRPGSGRIRVNKIPLEIYAPEIAKWKIMEPLLLSGDLWKQVDIDVKVKGGGFMGQAEAVRMSIARGLVEWFRSSRLKKLFISYDRSMIAGDPRRKEMKKFGGPGARRRRQKSYR
ncbi:30S ribosomal protein S9 [Candidatus Bathyarchaeota archaeon]|nr:MAG: 30S ribosomal protein S9 [Candidatus Bathyarchaeota archaeon]